MTFMKDVTPGDLEILGRELQVNTSPQNVLKTSDWNSVTFIQSHLHE